jgi:hypothetical protein
MTPPRSDNWSGCVGLFAALLLYLHRRRDRAALRMAAFGFLAGGIGFVVGDFFNMLGRAQWGPIGSIESLRGLDYWKWMEQSFGLIMGLGVGAAFLGRLRHRLEPPAEDQPSGHLNTVAIVFLLTVMFWKNLYKNVRTWAGNEEIPAEFFSADARWWFLAVGLLLTAVILFAIRRHRRGTLDLMPAAPVGRAQLLFLFILWIAVMAAFAQALPRMAHKGIFFVHTTFWITGALASLLMLSLPFNPRHLAAQPLPAADRTWHLTIGYWLCCLLIPLLLLATGYLTLASHSEPLHGSHLRFSTEQQ